MSTSTVHFCHFRLPSYSIFYYFPIILLRCTNLVRSRAAGKLHQARCRVCIVRTDDMAAPPDICTSLRIWPKITNLDCSGSFLWRKRWIKKNFAKNWKPFTFETRHQSILQCAWHAHLCYSVLPCFLFHWGPKLYALHSYLLYDEFPFHFSFNAAVVVTTGL